MCTFFSHACRPRCTWDHCLLLISYVIPPFQPYSLDGWHWFTGEDLKYSQHSHPPIFLNLHLCMFSFVSNSVLFSFYFLFISLSRYFVIRCTVFSKILFQSLLWISGRLCGILLMFTRQVCGISAMCGCRLVYGFGILSLVSGDSYGSVLVTKVYSNQVMMREEREGSVKEKKRL